MPVSCQDVGVSTPQSGEQQLVFYRATVDEEKTGAGHYRDDGLEAPQTRSVEHLRARRRFPSRCQRSPVRGSGQCAQGPGRCLLRLASFAPADRRRTAKNRFPGRPSAILFTISVIAAASARSDFRNFSLAGVAKKRSRTSTCVPLPRAAGTGSCSLPPSIVIAQA